MAQLVEVLLYHLGSRGFEFFIGVNLPAALRLWRRLKPLNRKEYKGYLLGRVCGWCVELTTLPLSCVDCLEVWEPQPPGTLNGPTEIPLRDAIELGRLCDRNLNCFSFDVTQFSPLTLNPLTWKIG